MTGRVLVVDDVVQNVKLLEAKLNSEYYTVFTASSGIECLKIVKDISPDIILLDVMMPEMDGFETCRRLKEDQETTHIPVVMVTALSEVSDRVQGLEAGADDFITKPIDELHLFARVKSLIRFKVMLDELRMRDRTGSEFGLMENNVLALGNIINGNVIIIDDDVVQSRKIKETLEEQGDNVSVKEPEDINTIINHGNISDNATDLIIINTLLDDADGLRLGMQIRSNDRSRHIPIMILVDEDDTALLVKGLEIGIDDYLITPMDYNELIARVNTQIKRKKYQDILKSNYEESLSAAVKDSLTGLYNRRYLDAHLNNIATDALSKNIPLSLMTIDIDHFKEVNDKPGWGHHIGDEVLIEVAKRILMSIRSTDLATRPGGEEFTIVMPNSTLDEAQMVAERTRNSMEKRSFEISAEPGEAVCTVSIGVSTLNLDGDTVLELLKRSDEALYEAKNNGRNQVVVSGNINKW